MKERYLATLAALEELSTRGPMATLSDITAQLKAVGYHDPLSETELRALLDQLLKWQFAEPFHDYAAPLRSLQGLSAREEAWALTQRGRGIVAAVRTAVVDVVRALQLPSRLLDGVQDTLREILGHLKDDHGRLPGDLEDVRTRIDELQRVTADFYAALAKMVQSDVTDDDVFGENRDRVVEALRQLPANTDAACHESRPLLPSCARPDSPALRRPPSSTPDSSTSPTSSTGSTTHPPPERPGGLVQTGRHSAPADRLGQQGRAHTAGRHRLVWAGRAARAAAPSGATGTAWDRADLPPRP
ncbi:DUF2397 family protein [Streptomyces massasporeus]